MSFSDDGFDLYPRTEPKQSEENEVEVDGVTAMQILGAQQMAEAKRWLHHNVNQHRRELGLPVLIDGQDLEGLKTGLQAVGRAYVDLTKKVIQAFAPIIKALGKPPEQDDWTLGR